MIMPQNSKPSITLPVNKVSKGNHSNKNGGFTLVELLISIAILVIIMVPLLNYFFRSMHINKEAEEIQIRSNLAVSIMEGLKAYDMPGTIEQFIGFDSNFNILDASSGVDEYDLTINDVTRLTIDDEEVYTIYDEDEEQATSYFAINGIRIGSTAFDALIKMDATLYRNDNQNEPEDVNTMNDYPIPEIINIDEKANALLLSEQIYSEGVMLDDKVIETFVARGRAYAEANFNSKYYSIYISEYDDYETALMQWNPSSGEIKPMPPIEPVIENYDEYNIYYDEGIVSKLITKTMLIKVSNDSVDYMIEYHCNWSDENINKIISHPVFNKKYNKSIENIYLFYTPSVYQMSRNVDALHPADVINIVNEDTSYSFDFFIAQQGNDIFNIPLVINRSLSPDNITIYTDISQDKVRVVSGTMPLGISSYVKSGTVKAERKDRIYDVTIDLYEYVDSDDPNDKYKNKLYTLNGTREK